MKLLPSDNLGRVSLPAVLELLHQAGVNRLMVEGGAAVITSFLSERLVDYFVLTIAPMLVGGYSAIENLLVEEDGALTPCFPRLIDMTATQLGSDLIVWGRPVWSK